MEIAKSGNPTLTRPPDAPLPKTHYVSGRRRSLRIGSVCPDGFLVGRREKRKISHWTHVTLHHRSEVESCRERITIRFSIKYIRVFGAVEDVENGLLPYIILRIAARDDGKLLAAERLPMRLHATRIHLNLII